MATKATDGPARFADERKRLAGVVSVVMPAYNRERYVSEAIGSVLSQDYEKLELIVVDDGSTDDTVAAVGEYLTDSRVKLIRQENRGQAVARNQALAASSGEFIGFIDSDDVWLQGKLTRQVAVLSERPDIDVVYGDHILIDAAGRVRSRKNMKRHSGRIYRRMLIDNCVSQSTVLARWRCFALYGGLNESIRIGDDYDLWLRLSARCRFEYVPEFFAKYRVSPGQLSSDAESRFATNRETIRRFFENNPSLQREVGARYIWSRFYTRRGRYRAGVAREFWRALGDYGQAIVRTPLRRHGWRALARLLLTGR